MRRSTSPCDANPGLRALHGPSHPVRRARVLLGVAVAAVGLLSGCAHGTSTQAAGTPSTSSSTGPAAASTPSATPTPTMTTLPTPIPTCWNGSPESSGQCPALTGQEALRWAFPLDGDATCTRIGPWDGDRITLQLQCVWPDAKHSSAYLMEFTSQADGNAFMSESMSGTTSVDLHLQGDSGPTTAMQWKGHHLTGGNGHQQDDTVVMYNSVPFGVWVGTDLTQGGTDADHDKTAARINYRPADEVGHVLDETAGS